MTKLPLAELWDDGGTVIRERIRQLNTNDIAELLRVDPVQFVVADCGLKLEWIPTSQRYEIWKTVKSQIASPNKPIYLAQFPNETAYIASEWRSATGDCLILLEKHH